ncbi:hypothetical protein GRF59_26655 [Paenibacillus sp. HJL G12]|uniref:Uncharacterized protein n=1 Tax=Paenibacillus dendrobii TaxID=2691084 RepID=A0A7X3LKE2_9BACL|nr:hypothetical protein [Paenibacillus dendrobii]MWV47180.1 hypothetical protein [Paenibacillus dendrobii]
MLENKRIRKESGLFVTCIESILSELSKDSILQMKNSVKVNDQVVQLVESYSLNENETIRIELQCDYNGISYSGSSLEEFDYALGELEDKMNIKFQVCANCNNGNITSISDLRHGWHCFRNIENQLTSLAWFERDEEFEESISNVSALHWCPKFLIRE